MARRNFKAGVILTGDSKGAVKAVDLTKENLQKLNKQLDMGADLARKHGRAIDGAVSGLGRVASGFASATKVAAAFAAAGVGAATVALTGLVREGLKAGDALAKTSDKLGIGTKELAGFRLAAEQTGVATNQFDTALQRLVRRTAEAAAGTGEAQAAFKVLGLEASELVRLSPDKVLGSIADAMNRVENQSQRVQLAFKLFDTEGVAMVNTLRLGSDGLARFTEIAEKLGIALDREAAAKIEDANDKLNLMSKAVSGLGQQLASKFAPIITGISLTVLDWIDNMGGVGEVSDKLFEFLSKGLTKVAQLFDLLRLSIIPVELSILKIREVWLRTQHTFLSSKLLFKQVFNPKEAAVLAQQILEIDRNIISTRESIDGATKSFSDLFEGFANGESDATAWLENFQFEFENNTSDLAELWSSLMSRIEGETIDAQGVLDGFGKANKDAASDAERAWRSATQNMARFFNDLFAGQIRNVQDFGALLQRAVTGQVAGSLGGFVGGAGGLIGGAAGSPGFGGVGGGFSTAGFADLIAGGFGLNSAALGAASTLSNLYTPVFGFDSAITSTLDSALGNIAGNFAGNILGGVVGTYVGNVAGEALFDKQAESNTGATTGAIIGSAIAPGIGTIIGAALGALVDVGTGSDTKGSRFVAGVATGSDTPRPNTFEDVIGASGLRIRGVANNAGRKGKDAAAQLFDTVVQLDEALTILSRAAGANVNLSGVSLAGQSGQAGRGGVGDFFGVFGFDAKGPAQGSDLVGAADRFVIAWLEEVNDQLPRRVREIIGGVKQTAAEIVTAFEAAIQIDKLLDLDVVKRTEEALELLTQEQKTLFETYQELTDAAFDASSGLDGTAGSLAELSAVLTEQKSIAAQLAANYRAVGIEVDALLGNTIQSIRESVLTDEQLYNLRREQIADLSAQLETAISPEELQRIGQQINSLTGSAFGLLDENQRRGTAGEFVDFLTGVNETIQARIDSGLSQVAGRESALNQAITVDLQGAQTFQDSANTIADALNNGSITININGTSIPLNLQQIAAGIEVNI